jgi:hypothetical protein
MDRVGFGASAGCNPWEGYLATGGGVVRIVHMHIAIDIIVLLGGHPPLAVQSVKRREVEAWQ